MDKKRLSRREFLGVTAGAVGGAILAACAPKPTVAPTEAPAEATEAPAEATPVPEEPTEVPAEAGLVRVEGEPYVDYLFPTVEDYEAATGKTIDSFGESPMLAELVEKGELPPVEERLPKDTMVERPREFIGQYGGPMRLLGIYERAGCFTGFTEDMQEDLFTLDTDRSQFYPNIVKGWDLSEDGKSLTLYLREGMKWSDGDDFDAKDFVFWYEDILQNPDITPAISESWMPGGELMGLNVIDDYTVQYTFAVPYWRVIEVFGVSLPAAPEHFLKQYIPKYNPDAEALAEEEGFETWQLALIFHQDEPYHSDPSAPTLNPWRIKEVKPDSALWERNPYYWKVDTAGNQLPYMDTLTVVMVEDLSAMAPVKTLAGELDLMDYSGFSLADYPVLKEAEERVGFKVYLWPRADQSHAMGFAFNYAHKDPVLREIFNDIRFRQALSLAINREEIGESLFLGLVEPYTAPVSPAWTGYEDWMGTYFAEYDVDKANALLDEMGLEWDENHQWRLRPDGKPIFILGTYCTEWLAYSEDLLDLVTIYWGEIGVQFEPKFVPEETLQTQFVANETEWRVPTIPSA